MADPVTDFLATIGAQTPLNILFNYILPLPILAYAFGLLLGDLKIFKGSGVRYVLGFFMAAILVFIVKIGALGMWLGIAGVLIFKMKDWPSRIAGLFVIAFIISQVGFTLDPNILLNKFLLIGFSIATLFVLLTDQSFIIKIVIVVILIIAYFVLLGYFPNFHV